MRFIPNVCILGGWVGVPSSRPLCSYSLFFGHLVVETGYSLQLSS